MRQLATGRLGERLTAVGNPSYPGFILEGGKKNLMVEAGLSLMGPLFLKGIEETLGSRDRLDFLFLTHSHYDHLGAARFLKGGIPGLMIGAHERVASLLLRESALALMNRLSEVQLPLFPDVLDYGSVAIGPTEIGLTLREGDEYDLGGLACRVLEVPGHTKDSLAFFIPEEGILFTGEAAGVPEGPDSNAPQVCFLSSYDDYLASLEKILSLAPGVLCLGHGWVFTGGDASQFLASSLAATPAYRALIERYLDEAHGDAGLATETMARCEYDERGAIRQERTAYLTNLEAQVKLVAGLQGK